MQLEEAIVIAKREVLERYPIESEWLENAYTQYEFDVSDAEVPLWRLSFAIDSIDTSYYIEIKAADGIVLRTYTRAASN
ncbi:MAG: hypothetical protein PHI98_14005 [Eubacteriales bacterium]|nr:hypothetical protein [Eubacteriales bacterium]